MQGPFVLLEVGGAETITGGHVISLEDLGDKLRRRFGRVGVVPVNQHIDIRINLFEHGPDDIALALPRFLADDGVSLPCYGSRRIRGIIVEDIQVGRGQSLTEIVDYLAYSHLLVVTGNKYGHTCFLVLPYLFHKAQAYQSTQQ